MFILTKKIFNSISKTMISEFSTMKHVALNGFGDPSVITLKESPIPVELYEIYLWFQKPKEHEALVRIKATGLNRADTLQV